jgi:hypothetical protein
MTWSDQIFSYCERGSDSGFWAEPANAISNAAFLVAALVAFAIWRARRRSGAANRPGTVELALIALVGVIGIGSFLFHTLATRWAAIADTAPIGLFMLAYLAYAGLRYVRAGAIGTVLLLVAFVAAHPLLMRLPALHAYGASVGYMPAWIALAGMGLWAAARRHPSAGYLLSGAVVFAASLTARTMDATLCRATVIGGNPLGTHVYWHILNATLLFLLLLAALKHGQDGPQAR